MTKLTDIVATLAILSAGTLTLTGCKKDSGETANPDEVQATDSAEGEGHCNGEHDGEASCSGDKEGEGSCSGEGEGEGSCSGEAAPAADAEAPAADAEAPAE